MMKKRLLSLLLAVCMVATLFSGLTVNASAGLIEDLINKGVLQKYLDSELLEELDLENIDVEAILRAAANNKEDNGACGERDEDDVPGDNIRWSYNSSTGVLTINGAGRMADYDFPSGKLAPWWSLSGAIGIQEIRVTGAVENIGAFAFCMLPNLKTIQLPDSCIELGRYAMAACNELQFPTLPEGLAEIGDYAMAACDRFTKLTLPTSVQTLGSHAFAGCDGFTSVTVPETVKNLGTYVFASCDGLTRATLPATVTAVPAGCFFNCDKLTSVTYNGTVTAIGDQAFSGCPVLTAAPIPATVTAIGDYAFSNCALLLNVALPEGLQTIGDYAFSDCEKLTKITLPESLQMLGEGAFSSCTLLASIALPPAITVVPENCFSACGLTDVTLAPTTTEIGAGAFSLCIILKTIALPDTLLVIHDSAFSRCKALETLALPDGLTTIGNSSFLGCEALTGLDVPGSVTSIGPSAFSGCKGLTEATFRASTAAQTIGSSAFALCTNLQDAYFYGDAPTVTAADAAGATFVKSAITIHYPKDNASWIVADGLWNGYKTETWSVCRHDEDGYQLTEGVTVAATCTTEGYTEYTCDHCGEVLRRDVTACIPHTEQATVIAPTCILPGYTKVECAVCGKLIRMVEDSATAPAGHKYELTKTVTAPTCTEKGSGEYTCTVCDDVATLPISATGHDPQPIVVAPTCTEKGYTKYICGNCNEEVGLRTDETPVTNHSWGPTQIVIAPTATATGLARRTCTACGTIEERTIPATGGGSSGGDDTACTGGPACPGYAFRDMPSPSYWSHEAIDYCLKNGILYGMSDTSFGPAAATTRGQLVTMLYRMQGSPEKYEMYYVPFTDVAPGAYYYAAVAWASDNEIVAGMGNGTFQPNAPITREQMAVIMMNYTGKCVGATTGSTSLNSFPDVGSVSSWARDAMSWAVANGIISGVASGSSTYLRPQGTAIREQVASILMRYELNIAK